MFAQNDANGVQKEQQKQTLPKLPPTGLAPQTPQVPKPEPAKQAEPKNESPKVVDEPKPVLKQKPGPKKREKKEAEKVAEKAVTNQNFIYANQVIILPQDQKKKPGTRGPKPKVKPIFKIERVNRPPLRSTQ